MNNQDESKLDIKEIPQNDIIKVIAVISMFIDHIGYGLFPELYFLRVVGRLAFPIFAYGIAIGYINTRNLRRYMLRLLLFAIVSQIPYIFFSPGDLNIMFTLLLGLCAIYFMDNNKYMLLPLVVIVCFIAPIDYGVYGVSVIVLFYQFRYSLKLTIISQVTATLAFAFLTNSPIQLFCILSLVLILKKWKLNMVLSKYFFYIFYPAHIAVITLIAKIFSF